MSGNQEARWALMGEAMITFVKRRRRHFVLPPALHRIPGPMAIIAQKFTDSPAGPYLSLAIGEPVRLGPRPGYFFGLSVVNSADARRLGRQYWGFPHELGTLRWLAEGTQRTLVWEERGIEVIADVGGRPLPLLLPLRSIQQRSDGPVVVPSRLKAVGRRSHVEVRFDEHDPLLSLGGVHLGLTLSGMVMKRRPARRASGLLTTLRAPLRAPEPGIVVMETTAHGPTTPEGRVTLASGV